MDIDAPFHPFAPFILDQKVAFLRTMPTPSNFPAHLVVLILRGWFVHLSSKLSIFSPKSRSSVYLRLKESLEVGWEGSIGISRASLRIVRYPQSICRAKTSGSIRKR